MNKTESDHLLTVSAVAGILRKPTDVIKRYEKSGKLRCIKTDSGMRLFRRADILQFARSRQQKKPSASHERASSSNGAVAGIRNRYSKLGGS